MPDKHETLLALSNEALAHEFDVNDRLTSRAEQYLTALGVILAVHALAPPQFPQRIVGFNFAGPLLFAIGAAFLLVATWLAIACLRVQRYPAYPATPELERITATAHPPEAVVEGIAGMLLTMRDNIRPLNDARGRKLKAIGNLLVIGLVLTIAGRLWMWWT